MPNPSHSTQSDRGRVSAWLLRTIPLPRWVLLVLWCYGAYGTVELIARGF